MPPRRRRPADPARVMADVTEMLLAEIAAHDDALDQARAATQYLALLTQARRQVALARIDSVGELRRTTALSIRSIAQELGVSANAIAQADWERRGRPRRRPPAPPQEAE